MAQTTQGTKVGWKAKGSSGSVYSYFPDLTGFPSMAGSATTIDTTTLDNDYNKTYIEGLVDLGGTLAFPALLTPELIEAVDAAVQAQANYTQDLTFCIEFAAPLNVRYFWNGQCKPVRPGEGGVDAAITTELRITPHSDIEKETIGA
jgi:hypothetical protein